MLNADCAGQLDELARLADRAGLAGSMPRPRITETLATPLSTTSGIAAATPRLVWQRPGDKVINN